MRKGPRVSGIVYLCGNTMCKPYVQVRMFEVRVGVRLCEAYGGGVVRRGAGSGNWDVVALLDELFLLAVRVRLALHNVWDRICAAQ